MKKFCLSACSAFMFLVQVAVATPAGDGEDAVRDIADTVTGLRSMEGYFTLYWDAGKGRLLLRIDTLDDEFIYQSSMPRGVGSNDLGLDRGQLGDTKLVEFHRSGPKILLIERNTGYRAISNDSAEQSAVDSSFGRSVIWAWEVLAETDGTVLVDATDFFLRDSHGLASRLARTQQGSYKPDPSRSAIFLERTKSFPDNTEVEALITYTGEPKYDDKGAVVSDTLSSVIPDPTSVTVHLHHSFIRLPDDGYTPLAYDPRAGLWGVSRGRGFMDYASAIGEPIRTEYGGRHRLHKVDPGADISDAVEPIIYYLDPGVPEPVRSALIEGASWWNQAFEAAGYRNAFQVRILPDDADPMDVRYNVIQWVHRSTRGWSYGGSVVDPRTGEILKGHVTLGSLRVRQDYLIAEGLLAPYENDEVPGDMLDMALARIRQLSAHEVGHTLGLEHNFAASVNDRSSVMDYPFPLIRFNEAGGLDLSDAYAVGIGEWDKRVIQYAYRDYPETLDAAAERRRTLAETIDSGLLFVASADSRDLATAHPLGNLWDNGADSIAELEHLMKVRAFALENLSERNIRPDRPMATIEEVLVPIYLLHRFQLQAVGKLLGGQFFSYQLRGDGQAPPVVVDADKQRAAIDALLETIEPQVLVLPESLVGIIPPRPPGHKLDRESFPRNTGVVFDPLSPASSAVSLTLDVMLNRQRAARMNAFHAADPSLPGFDEVLGALTKIGWYGQREAGMAGAVQRNTAEQLLTRLVAVAADSTAHSQVRAQAFQTLQQIDRWLSKQKPGKPDADWAAHHAHARHLISAFMRDPAKYEPGKTPTAPPGSPIGN